MLREKSRTKPSSISASAYTASIVAVNKNTYTLVQVNGVFTSNNVGNSTSLSLLVTAIVIMYVRWSIHTRGKEGKKKERREEKRFWKFFYQAREWEKMDEAIALYEDFTIVKGTTKVLCNRLCAKIRWGKWLHNKNTARRVTYRDFSTGILFFFYLSIFNFLFHFRFSILSFKFHLWLRIVTF